MRIRARAYLLGLLPALLVAILVSGYLGLSRIGDLDLALRERGTALARHVAQGAQYPVLSGNHRSLNPLLSAAAREREVLHVGIYQVNGEPVAGAGAQAATLRTPATAGIVDAGDRILFVAPVEITPLSVDDPFFQAEESLAPRQIGWVQVVLGRAGNEAIARHQLLATGGLVALGMVLTIILVHALVSVGVTPLLEIIEAVRGIAGGRFRVRLPLSTTSELRELQEGINTMSEALQSFQEDMQGRIDAATSELARRKEEAEQANLAKSRFLAAASHDLRQPMHAIALYVESMKPQVKGLAAAATLGKIEAAVVSMEALFRGILDISRLDAGAVVPEITTLWVPALFDRLHDEFAPEADAKGLSLRFRPCAAWMASDPVLIERILRNLLANALRYTERGGVLVTARRRRGGIRLQVWDTGQGIAPEHAGLIFEEYFQGANAQRNPAYGLGLGLAIVNRLARLLQHPLSFRSRQGIGTVFSLDVPVQEPCRADAPADTTAGGDLSQLHGTVAIVDDDPIVLDSLETLLTGWGLHVVRGSGSEDLIRHLSRAPDLLITDYRLRGEDGLQVAGALGAAHPDAPFPSIILTGDVSAESLRLITAGNHPVLHKPVRPARLRTLVSNLLRSRSRTTAPAGS